VCVVCGCVCVWGVHRCPYICPEIEEASQATRLHQRGEYCVCKVVWGSVLSDSAYVLPRERGKNNYAMLSA